MCLCVRACVRVRTSVCKCACARVRTCFPDGRGLFAFVQFGLGFLVSWGGGGLMSVALRGRDITRVATDSEPAVTPVIARPSHLINTPHRQA